VDPDVAQFLEQFGAIPFTDDEGRPANQYIDLLITKKDGRRIAVGVKPTAILKLEAFL
jgi:hypothetical protein